MNMNKFIALLLGTVLLSSCGGSSTETKITRPVKLHQVESLASFDKSFSGVVMPDEFSNLAFKMGGYITKMNVIEGQRVKRGDVVAEIDPQDFQLELDAQNAIYIKAKSQAERAKRLLEKDAISKQEAESFEAAYIGAESAYETMKNILADTKIVAPFDGFIQQKYAESYQRVQSGESVVRLINPNSLQVHFTIPETNVEFLSKGSKLYVEFDLYKGERFEAEVKEYVEASSNGAGVPVYLKITDEKFNSGDYKISVGFSCRVRLVVESTSQYKNSITVPVSAVVYDNESNKKSVFCYNPTTQSVERRHISDSGVIIGEEMLVVEGDLKVGDRIVAAGASYLIDNQKVKVLAN
ncbi:MAG: efflux RND transporter periplasmic adaptor subunit [Rikenellaceae bacterium]